MHLWQGAQNIGVKPFIGRQIRRLDAQQIFPCARDIMTFAHLDRARDPSIHEAATLPCAAAHVSPAPRHQPKGK